MHKVNFLSEVYEDIEEITNWYENKQKGMSIRFQSDFDVIAQKLSDYPDAFRKVYKDYRVLNLSIFPYKVFYKILEDKSVLVAAIVHQKRNPKLWKKRLRDLDI